MLAVSTYWLTDDEKSTAAWLKKVKDAGFDGIELGYRLRREQLAEFPALLKEFDLRVSSIHNFCPSPDDYKTERHPSNHYRLTALDEVERQLAVQWTNKSVDTARQFGARAVVIHAGAVDCEDNRSPRLFELYLQGKKDTAEFSEERRRVLAMREAEKGPYLESLEQSLSEVTNYAYNQGVKIGFETRYYPLEVPNFSEVAYFLDRFRSKGMGYWHDVGHAEMNDRLGITGQKEFLEAYKDDLIGVHLHGIQGRRDHLPPFEGDLDLEPLLTYFGPRVLKVVEARYNVTEDLMRKAVQRLNK